MLKANKDRRENFDLCRRKRKRPSRSKSSDRTRERRKTRPPWDMEERAVGRVDESDPR